MKKFNLSAQKYFQENIRDWKWWYKIVVFVLGLTAMLIVLISELLNMGDEGSTKWLVDGHWDYDSYLMMYFSFFTHQSIFMVLAWLLWAIIYPKKEGKGKLLGFTPTILIATYISITAIIWTGLLLPLNIVGGTEPHYWYSWASTLTLHLIVPITYLLYLVLWSKKSQVLPVKSWVKHSWVTIIYPLIYGIIMLIRYEVRYQSGFNGASSAPYFFFEIHNISNGIPNWIFFIIVILVIIGLAIGFSTLYAWSFKRVVKLKDEVIELVDLEKEKPNQQLAAENLEPELETLRVVKEPDKSKE